MRAYAPRNPSIWDIWEFRMRPASPAPTHLHRLHHDLPLDAAAPLFVYFNFLFACAFIFMHPQSQSESWKKRGIFCFGFSFRQQATFAGNPPLCASAPSADAHLAECSIGLALDRSVTHLDVLFYSPPMLLMMMLR